MDTCYLHIGTIKTGSTSLQSALRRHRAVLMEHGYLFPEVSQNYLFLASMFSQDAMAFPFNSHAGRLTKIDLDYWHKGCLQKLEKELDEKRSVSNLILSCERLADLGNKKNLAALRDLLLSYCSRVIVVAYVRPPLSGLNSFVQQKVKIGCSLETMHDNPPVLRYTEFLGSYAGVFGKENIRVRKFAKEELVNGDIVDDFLSVIGCSDLSGDIQTHNDNQSLSGQALNLADHLARLAPCGSLERQNTMFNFLFSSKGSPISLPRSMYVKAQKIAAPEVEWLRGEFGIDLTEPLPPKDNFNPGFEDDFSTPLTAKFFLDQAHTVRDLKSENFRLRAQIATKDGKNDYAHELLTEAAKNPTDMKSLRDFSLSLESKKAFEEALLFVGRALQVDPGRPALIKIRDRIDRKLKNTIRQRNV